MSFKIFHNPRCSKSRETLKTLTSAGINPEIIDYLTNPPTETELKDIIHKLGIKPYELVRKGEAIYKENYKGKELNDDQWIQAMTSNPKLIERPIVTKGDQAIIGRPPELVKTLM
ncbi:MAG: arsenate reductase (glutaredoxin) [Crocinitomicaceae bacterium]|nr:arsenate reductase (glutaredoxin) [Crocinitomicaceae bacterium]|tara:strand:+ start:3251 stop:3595 length:345 start_codon:yes stop_codon:yes gene_type:complete